MDDLGVKVWICKGEIYGKPDLFEAAAQPQRERAKPKGIKSFRKRNKK
jgi:small subunit ribosomal protein S3